jgi:N-acetyl-anhydromuramyl-L-alanine amidase AmpD
MNITEVKYGWAKPLYKRTVTRYIILHHEAGSGMNVQQIHQMHIREGWAGIGYHYFISLSGQIFRGRPENTIGTHCPGRNSDSVAVCCEGNFESMTMPEAQYQALLALVEDILSRYDVPVMQHKDFYATACPGEHYPYKRLLEDIKSYKEDDDMVRYARLKDVPDNWDKQGNPRTMVDKLMTAGIIGGDGSDKTGNNDVIDISADMLRLLAFEYRAGVYDAALEAAGLTR